MKAFKRLVVLTLAVLLTLTMSVSAFAEGIDGRVTVRVTGTGTVTMQPEQAIIRLGVQEYADNVVGAQQAVNKKIAATVAALEKNGIARENISVGYLNLYTNYQYDTSPYTVVGYSASHQLVIKTQDVAGTGKIIDAAISAGANQLDGIEFTAINSSTAYKKAMELAILDARDKALVVGAAYDKELGDIITVTENVNYYNAYNIGAIFKSEADSGAGTEIITGDLSITATVDVVYELLPKN